MKKMFKKCVCGYSCQSPCVHIAIDDFKDKIQKIYVQTILLDIHCQLDVAAAVFCFSHFWFHEFELTKSEKQNEFQIIFIRIQL